MEPNIFTGILEYRYVGIIVVFRRISKISMSFIDIIQYFLLLVEIF